MVGRHNLVDLDGDRSVERETAFAPVIVPRHDIEGCQLCNPKLVLPQFKLKLVEGSTLFLVALAHEGCRSFGAVFVGHVEAVDLGLKVLVHNVVDLSN